MSAIHDLGLLLGLTSNSGIRLYTTVTIVGLAVKFNWIADLPEGLGYFASWPIIIIAGILAVIELIVDKFQFFDNAWDLIHTLIRPFGGAMIGVSLLGAGNAQLGIIGFLIGGAAAFSSHSMKATNRGLISVSPEPGTNMIVSFGEDIFGIAMVSFILLNYHLTYMAFGIILVVGGFIVMSLFYFSPLLYRTLIFRKKAIKTYGTTLKKKASGLMEKVRIFFRKGAIKETPTDQESHQILKSDVLPIEHWRCINVDDEPKLVSECYSRRFKGVGKHRKGFLSLSTLGVSFTYKKLFKIRCKLIPFDALGSVRLQAKKYFDLLEIKWRKKFCSLAFLKNRSQLAEAFQKVILSKIDSQKES